MRMLVLLVNAVGTFAMMPVMIAELGNYWFGMWMLIGSIVIQYNLLDFGMSQTVVRFLSRCRGAGDKIGARQVYSTTLAAFLGIGGLTVLLTACCLLYLDQTVVDAEKRQTLLWAVGLVGLTASMAFPTYALEGSMASVLRQDAQSVLLLVRASSRILLTLWALRAGYGIVGIAAVTVCTDTVYRIALWHLRRRIYPDLWFDRSLVSFKSLKEMLGFGRFVFLTNVSKFSMMHSSVIVVSSLIGVAATGTYSIGLNVISRLEGMIRLGFFVAMPAFASIAAQTSDNRLLRQRFLTVTRFVTFGVSLIGGGLIFVGHDFILAWIGPGYGEAYWPLLILMSAWMLELCQIPALQLVTALGKHRRFAYYDLGVALFSIGGASLLAIPYGVNGVAIGVGVPVAISAIVLKSRNVCQELAMPLWEYLWQIGRIMGGSLALQVPVWLLLRQMPGMNLLELFIFGCLTYAPVALLVWLVIVPRSDQHYLVGMLPGRAARPLRKMLPYLREKSPR